MKKDTNILNTSEIDTKTSHKSDSEDSITVVGENTTQTEGSSMQIDDPSIQKRTNIAELLVSKSKNTTQNMASTSVANIPTHNRFEKLTPEEEDEIETNISENANDNKKSPPPPIVLHSKPGDHKKYINDLEAKVKNGFYVKYTLNNTNLFIKDIDEYHKYIENLKEDNVQFHTYTPKNERQHAFVLRGMDSCTDPQDILSDIKDKYKIDIHKIYKLKNTQRGLYLVVTDNTITLKFLNKHVQYVYHTKVTWELRRNVPEVIQCRRCQKWNHSTSGCNSAPKCLKCAQEHWTRECTMVHKTDNNTHKNIKCANCNGDHLAFSKECPVYKKKVAEKESMKPQPAVKYIPAPPPLINPWQRNIQQRLQQQTQQQYQQQQTTQSQQNQTQPQPQQKTIQHQQPTQQQQPNLMQNMNKFSELTSEFAQLNTLINVDKMLQLVRDLNAKLRECNNELEQFVAFQNFCATRFHP